MKSNVTQQPIRPKTPMSGKTVFRQPVQTVETETQPPGDIDQQLDRVGTLGHRLESFADTSPDSNSQPLDTSLRQQMESSFGTDFRNVRVHQGPQAAALEAVAFTQGNDIYFAPGEYRSGSEIGRHVIGHELAHVVQQRAGRVKADGGGDVPMNSNPSLEAEADALGAAAAAGHPATNNGCEPSLSAAGNLPPIQRMSKRKKYGLGFGLLGGTLGLGAGAAGGIAAGGALGAGLGTFAAPFTFGASIPIGAAIGAGVGGLLGAGIGAGALGAAGAVFGGRRDRRDARRARRAADGESSDGTEMQVSPNSSGSAGQYQPAPNPVRSSPSSTSSQVSSSSAALFAQAQQQQRRQPRVQLQQRQHPPQIAAANLFQRRQHPQIYSPAPQRVQAQQESIYSAPQHRPERQPAYDSVQQGHLAGGGGGGAAGGPSQSIYDSVQQEIDVAAGGGGAGGQPPNVYDETTSVLPRDTAANVGGGGGGTGGRNPQETYIAMDRALDFDDEEDQRTQ